jgi:hypothetical protein
VISRLPSLEIDTTSGTPVILPGKGITQVVEKKVVGDTGFEPVTSTVCRKQRKNLKRRK